MSQHFKSAGHVIAYVHLGPFGVDAASAADVERLVDAFGDGPAVSYREASTPRSHVSGSVFTSTEYNHAHRIFQHNENSHVLSFPGKLFFYCACPADEGGATIVTDCRRVLETVPDALAARLVEHGVLYRRRFGGPLGFPWRDVFETTDREVVDAYMAENRMVGRWEGDSLTVAYRRWATVTHPRSGEDVWFNHATFFHLANLEPSLLPFVEAFGAERMPYSTSVGDGTPLTSEDVASLGDAYLSNSVDVAWREGDLLAIDNLLVAHGRAPYRGDRRVLVAMREPLSASDVMSSGAYEACTALPDPPP